MFNVHDFCLKEYDFLKDSYLYIFSPSRESLKILSRASEDFQNLFACAFPFVSRLIVRAFSAETAVSRASLMLRGSVSYVSFEPSFDRKCLKVRLSVLDDDLCEKSLEVSFYPFRYVFEPSKNRK